ncbi:MAG: glycosyltransferase family 2 protein [Nitrospinae bacterium]|nr:glycosyltransferase family 2 protein [Nitrospinota bacterium]
MVDNKQEPRIAVVIPCYRTRDKALEVIAGIGKEVTAIYAVDDKCPENTGQRIVDECKDPRVRVMSNKENLGVGGAVMAGYRQALADGMDIIVKVDADGQMDPRLIPRFVKPVLTGEADYTKGNRFFNLESVRSMPKARLIGNLGLSFLAKLSTGYWDLFDPTNGFTAIHAKALELLPLAKISNRYFFETDMLFRLNTVRAVVVDIPMEARYEGETSSLQISRVFTEFALKHAVNMAKRVIYNYFLRDFSIASVELVAGTAFLLFGVVFGVGEWLESIATGEPATSGTVMLAALPVIIGTQSILAFLSYDINSKPKRPLSSFI